MPPKASTYRARDLKLLAGFGLFAELVVGYMLMVDRPLTQLTGLNNQLNQAREAHAALTTALAARPATPEAAGPALPPVLAPRPGEGPSVAIQRHLNGWVATEGVTPLALTVAAKAEAPGVYMANLTVEGRYESVSRLIASLERPSVRLGLDQLTIEGNPEDPDRVKAEAVLPFYFPAPAAEAAASGVMGVGAAAAALRGGR